MIACAVAAALFAAPAAFALDIDSKSGAVQFAGSSKPGVKVSLGKRLKFEPEFKSFKIGKGHAVEVGADAHNSTDQKIFFSYHVALLDKEKNVIGCQNFTLWADPGKKVRIGNFITLPSEQIAKIASYSVIFYEDDEQIGNK
jgi:hypothetical protein